MQGGQYQNKEQAFIRKTFDQWKTHQAICVFPFAEDHGNFHHTSLSFLGRHLGAAILVD